MRVLASAGDAAMTLMTRKSRGSLAWTAGPELRTRDRDRVHLAAATAVWNTCGRRRSADDPATQHSAPPPGVRRFFAGWPVPGWRARAADHEGHANDHGGRRCDGPQARAWRETLAFRTRRTLASKFGARAWSARGLQLRADAGARFEFGGALRADLQMALDFPAGFLGQFAAEIASRCPRRSRTRRRYSSAAAPIRSTARATACGRGSGGSSRCRWHVQHCGDFLVGELFDVRQQNAAR